LFSDENITDDRLTTGRNNNHACSTSEIVSRRRTNMNKAQFIEKIAAETKMPKAQCENIVDCFMTNVKKTVKKGDDVKLVGFGTFTKAKRKARMGRNPQTGKSIKIPAAWAPKFRAGAEFKHLVK
jgi:DNA-binding protein HU-beta